MSMIILGIGRFSFALLLRELCTTKISMTTASASTPVPRTSAGTSTGTFTSSIVLLHLLLLLLLVALLLLLLSTTLKSLLWGMFTTRPTLDWELQKTASKGFGVQGLGFRV